MDAQNKASETQFNFERSVEDILRDADPGNTPEQDVRYLYTGTSEEDLQRKLESSNGEVLEDWEDRKLWFSPYLHDHPKSAVYYASKAISGGQCRDYQEANTPIMIEWKVPESRIYELDKGEIGPKEIAHSTELEEFWSKQASREWMTGYIKPSEGPRLKEGYELDPVGWEFQSYESLR